MYKALFLIFAKIGAFTIGGGYAMVPLIEEEIVNRRCWLSKEEFLDLLAIAQSSPGILAVNIAIFIGYRLRGVKGCIVASLGSILPSFLIILAIALFFHQFKENTVVERIFRGIRPAVVALIAAPTFGMAKSAKINRYTVWIPIVSALLIWQLGFSPIWIIIAAGVGGYLYGKWTNKNGKWKMEHGKADSKHRKGRLYSLPLFSFHIPYSIIHLPFIPLFYTFFKIGLFGFGGGYAMLSLIQGEVVTRHGWLTAQEFTDIVAISQMTPGPIGINSATYVGYSTLAAQYGPSIGVLGSIVATLAVVLPSFILMLTISRFFLKYQKYPVVENVFRGLRPAVVGLLASAALLLMNEENFSSPTTNGYAFIVSCLLFVVAFVGTFRYKVHPIRMILLCGLAGWLLY